MADIGKDFGLRQQLGEKGSEFQQRIKAAKEGGTIADKFGGSTKLPDRPGQDGQKDSSKPGKDSPKNTLDSLVGEIKKLLEKIEPRLPVAALTA
jgi:hypothetical protein